MNGDRPDPAGAVLKRVAAVLRTHQVADFAFTGGVAVGVWAVPRQTKDIDLCGASRLIHKMIKLRHDRRRMLQDLADVRAVIAVRGDELDWEYVRRWARPEESVWLDAVGGSTDEELVRRLLGA